MPPGRRVIRRDAARRGRRLVGSPRRGSTSDPALSGGLGQLVVVVRPATASRETRSQRVSAWVQATRIGLDAFADGETLLAWANDLSDGRPLADVELALGGARARSTDERPGAARPRARRRAAAPGASRRRPRDPAAERLVVERRRRLPARTARGDALRFFVFDDRRLYRPGEEVHVKGWLRRSAPGRAATWSRCPKARSSCA